MRSRSTSLVLLTEGPPRADALAPEQGADDTSGPFGFGGRAAREPLRAFHPGAKARISFVWWERNLDDPSPLFVERDDRIVTLIAVWPTDARGEVVVGRFDDVRVRTWAMTRDVFLHLEARHRRFHLGRYDLVVWAHAGGIRSVPTFDSRSVFRAILMSERPEAAAVRERIDEVLHGHAKVA